MAATAVAVKIDTDMKERLKNLDEAKQRSAHWRMCEAISQYVKREEKQVSFRQDTMKSWE